MNDRREYGCTRCQKYHRTGQPLFDAHLMWQSKHGVRLIHPVEWLRRVRLGLVPLAEMTAGELAEHLAAAAAGEVPDWVADYREAFGPFPTPPA